MYLLLSICILAVISQTLEKKREILISPLIVFLISFGFLSRYRVVEALIGSSVIFLLFLYNVRRSYFLKDNLTVLKIRHSARNAVTGFLFVVSVFAGFSVLLVSEQVLSIDVGQKVADITEKPIKEAVMQGYENEITKKTDQAEVQNVREKNPQVILTVLESLGITDIFSNLSTNNEESFGNSISGSIKKSVANKVNDVVEPYRKFFSPTLALLVLGIFQIYSWISYILYSQIINLILIILKKTKFVRIEKETIEREVLRF